MAKNRASSLPVREVWIEIPSVLFKQVSSQSLPVREVWIEIISTARASVVISVTSREGSVD